MLGQNVNIRNIEGCKRIRLLHLVSTFAVKTDTKWLYQLMGRLPRDRFEPAIACMYGGGEMMQHFAGLGVQTWNLAAPGGMSPLAVWRAYRLIRSFDPQIVHTHLLRADLYGGLAARLAGVPVVLSTAYALGAYSRDKIRRLDGVLDRMCRAVATDGLAVSDAVRSDLIERLRWPAERVSTIHTGITFRGAEEAACEVRPSECESERVRIRDAWHVPNGSPLVLTVARLSYEKGLDVLIDAAAHVRDHVPDARYVVVGDGPLRDTLQRRITAAGLENVVRLVGFRKDISTILSAADLFVLPSLSEGMPNAVLEAYAAGLPVVTTSAGGLSEAVAHEVSGLLVSPGNAEALATAITRVLQDETLRCRLMHDGQAWARKRFSIERIVDQYAEFYERLYAERAGVSQARLSQETCDLDAHPAERAESDNATAACEDTDSACALPKAVDICGLPVRPVSRGQFIGTLVERAKQGIRTRVHYLNAHTFNLACDQRGFRQILTTSDLLYADGMSVVWAGRWLGRRIPERLSAADYFTTFCQQCAAKGVSVFLLGGAEGVSQATAWWLTRQIPTLRVAGTHWGYFSEDQTQSVIELINESGADVLVVGMGSPCQEKWVARYADALRVPVRWTVGALFDYFADREPRAPQWMCRCGGEWIYRLLSRPRERWRRYLVGNPRFLWLVFQEWLAGVNGQQVA